MNFNRLYCRGEATRTPDPHVPNVVRYQLRYTPNCISITNRFAVIFDGANIDFLLLTRL